MKILITGAAGFIGSHLANRMLESGDEIVGLDNINDYYDTALKYGRLTRNGISKDSIEYGKTIQSDKYPNFKFIKINLEDKDALNKLFSEEKFDRVCNLAAQAGVRYSITNPDAYIQSNIVGFSNLLESCRHHNVAHLVYASSSSVYGLNENLPFSTKDNVDHPMSLYAATKKSNELMAHTYSHLFDLPTTGLRFFTVYGPWGRPDMALFLFTDAILSDKPIKIYNHGKMLRDFTYIDDIVEGIVRVLNHPPVKKNNWKGELGVSSAPYKIYNIGNNEPVMLLDFVEEIEKKLNKKAIKDFLPLQAGDVPATFADVTDLVNDVNYKPDTSIKKGVGQFVDWYLEFYKVK